MKTNRNPSLLTSKISPRVGGFSIAELVVVVGILAILGLIAAPSLTETMLKSRTMNSVREVKMQLRLAQQEAIRRGVEVVVHVETLDNRETLVAFADVPEEGDPPDRQWDPDTSAPYRTTDYEVFRVELPVRYKDGNERPDSVVFTSPDSRSEHFDDGTALPTGDRGLVFRPDGSVDAVGGVMFGDLRTENVSGACGNCFRLRFTTVSGGSLRTEKWDHNRQAWLEDAMIMDNTGTKARGNTWTWYR